MPFPSIPSDDLTVKDAALLLGVSESFIRDKARKGLLSHFKVGAIYKFSVTDITNFKQRVNCENPINATEPALE